MKPVRFTTRIVNKRHTRFLDDNYTKELEDTIEYELDINVPLEEQIADIHLNKSSLDRSQKKDLREWVDEVRGKEQAEKEKVPQTPQDPTPVDKTPPAQPDAVNEKATLHMMDGSRIICPMCWDGMKHHCDAPIPGKHTEVLKKEAEYCQSKKMLVSLCREHQNKFWDAVGRGSDQVRRSGMKAYVNDTILSVKSSNYVWHEEHWG